MAESEASQTEQYVPIEPGRVAEDQRPGQIHSPAGRALVEQLDDAATDRLEHHARSGPAGNGGHQPRALDPQPPASRRQRRVVAQPGRPSQVSFECQPAPDRAGRGRAQVDRQRHRPHRHASALADRLNADDTLPAKPGWGPGALQTGSHLHRTAWIDPIGRAGVAIGPQPTEGQRGGGDRERAAGGSTPRQRQPEKGEGQQRPRRLQAARQCPHQKGKGHGDPGQPPETHVPARRWSPAATLRLAASGLG